MEPTLNVGQTVWHNGGKYKLLAQAGDLLWVVSADGHNTLRVEDVSTVDPDPPAPAQTGNCPVCGSRTLLASYGYYHVYCVKDSCLKGPVRHTPAEAVDVWKGISFAPVWKPEVGDPVLVVSKVFEIDDDPETEMPYRVEVGVAGDSTTEWFTLASLRQVPK